MSLILKKRSFEVECAVIIHNVKVGNEIIPAVVLMNLIKCIFGLPELNKTQMYHAS